MSENSGGGEIEIDWKIPEVWSARGGPKTAVQCYTESGRSVCRLTAGWKAIYKVFSPIAKDIDGSCPWDWLKNMQMVAGNMYYENIIFPLVKRKKKRTNCVTLCTL